VADRYYLSDFAFVLREAYLPKCLNDRGVDGKWTRAVCTRCEASYSLGQSHETAQVMLDRLSEHVCRSADA
jgi:hypothetical protein